MQATVRLKVMDGGGQSYGTGTIIHTHGDEALVLTCGHLFRESKGAGQIQVTLFAPGASRPVAGTLLVYEAEQRDVALVSIRPGVPVTPIQVGSPQYHPRPGDPVFTIGCNHGENPTIQESVITAVDRYLGPPNLEVRGHPVEGRSGGGLFSANGQLIGVCNAADLQEDRGIYAGPATICLELKRINLANICATEPPTAGFEPVTRPLPPAVLAAPAVTNASKGSCPE